MSKSLLPDAAGKVAFVTGAAGGMGGATVDMFLEAGCNVVASDRREVARDHDRLLKLTAEATDEAQVAAGIGKAKERFGRIDFLVHLAGMVGKGRLDEMDLKDWHTVVDTNLTSAFLLLKYAYPHLTKPGAAVVLCSSSNGANGGSYLSGPAYASSKAALVNLCRYAAKEWAPDGIRVNVISPGPVDTPMLDRLSPQQHDGLKAVLPLGKYATADECAGGILYLCSRYAHSMTGTNMNISSGLVMDR